MNKENLSADENISSKQQIIKFIKKTSLRMKTFDKT